MEFIGSLPLRPLALLCLSAATLIAQEAPPRLSETGLFKTGTREVDPRNLAYSPQYPLWTDGATKARWAYLPPGSSIRTKDQDSWDFPVGSKFWKTFSFGGKRVETRLMWKAASRRWVYATYLWNAGQTDADLAPAAGVDNHHPLPGGKAHRIPGVQDCKACHEHGRPEVLGFSALQLSTDRDPLAPHKEMLEPGMATLASLEKAGWFVPARPDWVTTPPRIPASTPRTRAVLGYLSSNCGSCHQTEGPNARLGLNLKHLLKAKREQEAPGYATTVDREGLWGIVGAPPGQARRIKPGNPALSTVYHRMGIRGNAAQMPNLGSVLVDSEALALVRAWIQEDQGKADGR